MKKMIFMRFILILMFLCCSWVSGFGQGIAFFEGSVKEALKKAKAEGKGVFVDFMAEWCAPCKQMSSEVFVQQEVGDYFNKHFVCVKVDVDKEKGVAMRYEVKAMPTLIFLDAKGKVVYRSQGAVPVSRLLYSAKIATGEALSFEDTWKAYEKDKSRLDVQQMLLLEAPVYMKGLQNPTEAKKWNHRIGQLFKEYTSAKPKEEMVNQHDFIIIMMYCMPVPQKNNELVELVIKNYSAYCQQVDPKKVSEFLINYTSLLINELAKQGDLDYKKEIQRVSGDLKPAFESLQGGGISLEEILSNQADALYCIYAKGDQVEYIKLKNDYLERLGDKAKQVDYQQAAMTLIKATQGKITKESAQQSLLWLDKVLSYKSDAASSVIYLLSMGNCFLVMENRAKAKECFSQAYMMSLQTPNKPLQEQLKRKIESLQAY